MEESSTAERVSEILEGLVGSLPAVDFGIEDSDEVNNYLIRKLCDIVLVYNRSALHAYLPSEVAELT